MSTHLSNIICIQWSCTLEVQSRLEWFLEVKPTSLAHHTNFTTAHPNPNLNPTRGDLSQDHIHHQWLCTRSDQRPVTIIVCTRWDCEVWFGTSPLSCSLSPLTLLRTLRDNHAHYTHPPTAKLTCIVISFSSLFTSSPVPGWGHYWWHKTTSLPPCFMILPRY